MTQRKQEGLLLEDAVMPAFLCYQADVPVPFIFLQSAEQLLQGLHGPQARLIK